MRKISTFTVRLLVVFQSQDHDGKKVFGPKIFQFQSNNCGIDVDLNDDSLR